MAEFNMKSTQELGVLSESKSSGRENLTLFLGTERSRSLTSVIGHQIREKMGKGISLNAG